MGREMVSDSIPSRDEINIKRLLARCEEMSKLKPDPEEIDWRLRKYIESLEEMMNDISSKPYKPEDEVMSSYQKRLKFLKSYIDVQTVESPLDKLKVYQATPKPSFASENRDVEQTATESVHSKVRDELFGKNENQLRKRTPYSMSSQQDSSDLDELLKHQHTMHEKIAENMLVLARNIKEQSLVAGNIIRNDSSNLEKSAQLADKNITHLRTQSDKLQENTRKTSHCWIWILVFVVIVVFVNMVLLMKMTRKKA